VKAARPFIAQVVIVVVGIAVGAVLAIPHAEVTLPGLLASVAFLVVTGVIVGAQDHPYWEAIPLGSGMGAVLVLAWAASQGPSDMALGTVQTSLYSVIAFGLVMGVAWVLPGYLFGRAFRGGDKDLTWDADASDPAPPVAATPSRRRYAIAGFLILVADVVLVMFIIDGLSHLGY
jgi:hypothetical protein